MKQQQSMVSEVNALMKCIEDVDHNLNLEQIPSKVLLLMGETKAGKTTLMYYLLRKKLILEHDQGLSINVMKPEAMFLDYAIGNSYESTTVYPNIPPPQQDDCLIIDMPGFSDTRPLYRLLNIYIILKTIEKIKNVHVIFVLPSESLDGDSLVSALQNSCMLLNKNLLKAEKCSSFILTKLEDEETDKQTFQQYMESFKQDYLDDAIGPILENFDKSNTYSFGCQEPNVQQGGQLKETILSENTFFPVDQKVDNFLSPDYAKVIVGHGNLEQFCQYGVDMIQQIYSYLPPLVSTLKNMLDYHHFSLQFSGSQARFHDGITEKLISEAKDLSVFYLCQVNPDLKGYSDENKQALIIFFMKEAKIIKEAEGKTTVVQKMETFCKIFHLFSQQTSGISQQFRKKVFLTLQHSLMILITLKQVNQHKVQEQLKSLFDSEQLQESLSDLQTLFNQENIKKIINLPESQDLLQNNEQFQELVRYVDQDALNNGPQIIKTIHERTYDKLHHKNFKNILTDTVKSVKDLPIKETVETISGSFIPQESTIKTLSKKLSETKFHPDNLKHLLKTLKQWQNKKQELNLQQISYKLTLIKKIIFFLEQSQQLEQAILFTMYIPDLTKLQTLVNVGIKFNELSSEFIQDVLLPYFSQVQFNFQMVEKLYAYLLVLSTDIEELARLENSFVQTVERMRKNMRAYSGESLFETNRFNFDYVEYLTSGKGLINLMTRVKKILKTLNCAPLHHQQVHDKISNLLKH